MTDNDDVLSFARFFGLKKGTSAPYRMAISAISLSSVDTITRSMYLELSASSIVYEIKGLPPRNLIFFLGKPFDPPRAGIKARTDLFLYILIIFPLLKIFNICFILFFHFEYIFP